MYVLLCCVRFMPMLWEGEKRKERERERESKREGEGIRVDDWWRQKNLKKERQRERDRAFEYENTSIWILELGVRCLFFPEVKGSNTEWGGGGGREGGILLLFSVMSWQVNFSQKWPFVCNFHLFVCWKVVRLFWEGSGKGREGNGEGSTKQKFIMLAKINKKNFK
jgi:hypothetical protein